MTHDSTELAVLADAVQEASGIVVKQLHYDTLAAAYERAFGTQSTLSIADFLPGSTNLQLLVEEVAVKETSFFRDEDQLSVIPWHALLTEAQQRGETHITVWSAGCATGEEVYSLAILACEAFATDDPPVRIIGTDQSQKAIDTATAGHYSQRSLRSVSIERQEKYFCGDDDVTIIEPLHKMVSFRCHNFVADTTSPSAEVFSAIVCRNVFIYFEPTTIERVLRSFRNVLAAGGVLVTSATDVISGAKSDTFAPLLQSDTAASPSNGEDPLIAILHAAGAAQFDEAIALLDQLLRKTPRHAAAQFVRGNLALQAGQPIKAVASFRAALYADENFGEAAFMLGRSYDALNSDVDARNAYEQALRLVATTDQRYDFLFAQVGHNEIAAACRARLGLAVDGTETMDTNDADIRDDRSNV